MKSLTTSSNKGYDVLHLQTRLHALEVCDMLFGRSRAFRTAAAAQFPALLVGCAAWSLGVANVSHPLVNSVWISSVLLFQTCVESS